jgi:hypothetical protein
MTSVAMTPETKNATNHFFINTSERDKIDS